MPAGRVSTVYQCTTLLRGFHCRGTVCTLTLMLMSSRPIQPDSDLDLTDPDARTAQTFPRLSKERAARVAAYGTEERLPKGTLVNPNFAARPKPSASAGSGSKTRPRWMTGLRPPWRMTDL